MNKVVPIVQILVSTVVGAAINFFILRAVLGRLHRPRDQRQRTRVAVAAAMLLAVPAALNSRRIAAAEIEATHP